MVFYSQAERKNNITPKHIVKYVKKVYTICTDMVRDITLEAM